MDDRYPYFWFYADDFLAGTVDMTDAEVGSYIRLLAVNWSKGSIDPERLPNCCESKKRAARILLWKFAQSALDAQYRSDKLEKVRAQITKKVEAGRKGGQTSAERRKQTPSKRPSKRQAKSKQTPNNQNQNQNQISNRSKSRARAGHSTTTRGKLAASVATANAPPSEEFDQGKGQEGERPPWEADALRYAVRLRSKMPPPKSYADQQLIARAAILAASVLTERWLADALGGITETASRRPYAKLRAVLRERAEAVEGANFDALAERITPPRCFYRAIEEACQATSQPNTG